MEAMMLEHFTGRDLGVAVGHREAMAQRVLSAARAAHEARRLVAEMGGQLDWSTWDDSIARKRRDGLVEVMEILDGSVDPTPSASHERWLAQKVSGGWRLGDVKDETAKTHPCMVPYEDLPQVERSKDYMGMVVICASLGLPSPAPYRTSSVA